MNENQGKRFQFSLASIFAAMTLAALAMWARSLWWIPVIWVCTLLYGLVVLTVFVVIVRILGWVGGHIVRCARRPLAAIASRVE